MKTLLLAALGAGLLGFQSDPEAWLYVGSGDGAVVAVRLNEPASSLVWVSFARVQPNGAIPGRRLLMVEHATIYCDEGYYQQSGYDLYDLPSRASLGGSREREWDFRSAHSGSPEHRAMRIACGRAEAPATRWPTLEAFVDAAQAGDLPDR